MTHQEPHATTEQLLEADRREPNAATFASGVSSAQQHAALRASVRQLGALLGEALTRHEGPELLALVERVRGAGPRARGRRAARRCSTASTRRPPSCWPAPSPPTSSSSTSPSSCTAGRSSAPSSEAPLAATVAAHRRGARGRAPSSATSSRTCWPGSSTGPSSPPTPPRRRAAPSSTCSAGSPMTVDELEDPRRPATDGPRAERRLAELVDLMWQTDELRIVRPEPTDEARTATYYLRFLADQVVPDLLAELDRTLAGIGVAAAADGPAAAVRRLGRRRPRRQPQRHARGHPRRSSACSTTPASRELVDEARPPAPRAVVLDPRRRRSPTRCASSLERDARGPPDHLRRGPSAQRRGALPAQAELRARPAASAPATASTHGTAHEPGRDYADLRRAARRPRPHPRLDARRRRPPDRRRRDPAADPHGASPSASASPRSTSASTARKHHAALADLYDRIGELDTALRRARPRRRASRCSPARWPRRRPLIGAGPRRPGAPRHRRPSSLFDGDPAWPWTPTAPRRSRPTSSR